MKALKVVVILILLVGLPAMSWYYLSTGADWRRQGWDEMSLNRRINPGRLTLANGQIIDPDTLLNRYIIATRLKGGIRAEVLPGLYDQFDNRNDILLLDIGTNGESYGWDRLDCTLSDCNHIESEFFQTGEVNTALLDKDLTVKKTYDISDRGELRDLVRHAGIMLPVEKREKIELRRGSNQ